MYVVISCNHCGGKFAYVNIIIDNFKPESVDSTKAGTVEMSQTGGGTSVRVERASIQVRFLFIIYFDFEPTQQHSCVIAG